MRKNIQKSMGRCEEMRGKWGREKARENCTGNLAGSRCMIGCFRVRIQSGRENLQTLESANDHSLQDLSLVFFEDSRDLAMHTHIERGRVAQKSFCGLHLIDHRLSNWPLVGCAAELRFDLRQRERAFGKFAESGPANAITSELYLDLVGSGSLRSKRKFT